MVEPLYSLTVPGLQLPRLNVVLRWNRWKRYEETKRVRMAVSGVPQAGALVAVTPLEHARVHITAYGPYGRRDGDATYFKDALDAIVARKVRYSAGLELRRWGLCIDDSRECIDSPVFETVIADEYRVVIEVFAVNEAAPGGGKASKGRKVKPRPTARPVDWNPYDPRTRRSAR